MNNKIAKEIRRRLNITTSTPREYSFYTAPICNETLNTLTYKFTYITKGDRKIYKIAKKIWKMFKVLPSKRKKLC